MPMLPQKTSMHPDARRKKKPPSPPEPGSLLRFLRERSLPEELSEFRGAEFRVLGFLVFFRV